MASGDTLLIFLPQNNEPPASAFATFSTRNATPVLEFDATTDEEAVFSAVLPGGYAGGGMTVSIGFMAASATTGGVVWQAAFERGDTDRDADSFAAFQTSGAVTVSGTSGIIAGATVTFTNGAQMDSIAVHEAFRLKIRRDADSTSGTDDATGDAQLVSVEIREV